MKCIIKRYPWPLARAYLILRTVTTFSPFLHIETDICTMSVRQGCKGTQILMHACPIFSSLVDWDLLETDAGKVHQVKEIQTSLPNMFKNS